LGDASIDLSARIANPKSSVPSVCVSVGETTSCIAARLSKPASCSVTNCSIASAIAMFKRAMSESIGDSIETIPVRFIRGGKPNILLGAAGFRDSRSAKHDSGEVRGWPLPCNLLGRSIASTIFITLRKGWVHHATADG